MSRATLYPASSPPKGSNIVHFSQNVPNYAPHWRLLWVLCKIQHCTKPLPSDFDCEWKTRRLPVVLWPLCSCADWAAYRWAQYVWCSGINNERKAIASLWLLCGSEEALCGWKRLMKSTRESGRVPTAQRCNPNRSPCTCFEAPLLSSAGYRSFNDLQISLIFPENIVGTVLSPSLSLFVVRLPTDGLQKQQGITTSAAQTEWFVCAALVSNVIWHQSASVFLIVLYHLHHFKPFITAIQDD